MRYLTVRRRSTSPIAMGRTPPLGFGTATSPAPARTGATARQAWPCAKQVQYPGEVFGQGVGGARRPCFTKVLDPEARGAGGCVGRETPQSSCHDFFRELVRQGQGSQVNLWGKLRRVKCTQCSSCGSTFGTQPRLKEGIASLTVESFTGKANCQLATLLLTEWLRRSPSDQRQSRSTM